MNLYVINYGNKIRLSNEKVIVENNGEVLVQYPLNIVKSVVISSRSSITSQCLEKLIKNGVTISWIAYSHEPFATLMNPYRSNVLRQQKQFELLSNEECYLSLAKKIILAKVLNQRVILQRLERTDDDKQIGDNIKELKIYSKQIELCDDDETIRGYEGICARTYFDAIKQFVPVEFNFEKRTKNPPTDKFSSILSFLYTLLFNEIMICVINAGLNPYVGFVHELKNNHPALVSDLMEEWRAIIADSVALNLVLNQKIKTEDFNMDEETGAYYLNYAASKILIAEFERKMITENLYLQRDGFGKQYRDSMQIQIASLCDVLENNDSKYYEPIIIR